MEENKTNSFELFLYNRIKYLYLVTLNLYTDKFFKITWSSQAPHT